MRRPNTFERAVARERQAIHTHERAAVAEDASAALMEEQAHYETDPTRRDELTRRARADRDRADRARGRAVKARKRRADEGVES